MNREHQLLMYINENEQISQRQLAKALNLSLGTINGLIAQMLQQGYILVDHIQPKQSKYHLTPLGLKLISRGQYQLICDSFHVIAQAKAHIRKQINHKIQNGVQTFYLLGEEDEIFNLAKMSLIDLKRNYPLKYKQIHSLSEVESTSTCCVLYWDEHLYQDSPLDCLMII